MWLTFDGADSRILCCISRVHLALYTEKAASKSICCYPWLYVSCYTVGWSYFTSKWCWSISLFYSYKSCRKARGFSSGKELNTLFKNLQVIFYLPSLPKSFVNCEADYPLQYYLVSLQYLLSCLSDDIR